MEESILISTKKMLGISSDYKVFDLDIITHINTVFSILTQLGVVSSEGFMIEDESEEWGDVIGDNLNYLAMKSYVFLKVRMLFDPPTTSYLITAMNEQIRELEWRLNVTREGTEWIDPDPPTIIAAA